MAFIKLRVAKLVTPSLNIIDCIAALSSENA